MPAAPPRLLADARLSDQSLLIVAVHTIDAVDAARAILAVLAVLAAMTAFAILAAMAAIAVAAIVAIAAARQPIARRIHYGTHWKSPVRYVVKRRAADSVALLSSLVVVVAVLGSRCGFAAQLPQRKVE